MWQRRKWLTRLTVNQYTVDSSSTCHPTNNRFNACWAKTWTPTKPTILSPRRGSCGRIPQYFVAPQGVVVSPTRFSPEIMPVRLRSVLPTLVLSGSKQAVAYVCKKVKTRIRPRYGAGEVRYLRSLISSLKWVRSPPVRPQH